MILIGWHDLTKHSEPLPTVYIEPPQTAAKRSMNWAHKRAEGLFHDST
jgi:hypothetical protein